MKQIIAFGDSNTWGLNPVLKNRYPENVRWTAPRFKGGGSSFRDSVQE